MKNRFCQAIFLIAFFQSLSLSFAIELNINNQKPHCFFLDLKKNSTTLIQYEIIGYKPEEFIMNIYEAEDPQQVPIHTIKDVKKASYELIAQQEKEYKVCFKSLDNAGKILQFEFRNIQTSTEEYADDKALQATYLQSQQAYYIMNDIYTNLRHSLMKTETQTSILMSTENKVKWCSIVKMLLMISITGVQLIFLTGLFKDYSPMNV